MKRLWNLILNYWREALLVILLGGVATLLYYWTVDRPDDTYAQAFMLIGLALCLAGAIWLIKSLWRDKWRQAATRGMQKIFARIQRFFEKFADRLGIRRGNKSVLGGKTTVFFDRITTSSEETSARAAKPPKWKQLDSERARMRYLYRGVVSGKLKRGALIYSFDTPIDVEEKLKARGDQTEAERELLQMYIDLRYDERRAPDEEQVKRLKKELDVK